MGVIEGSTTASRTSRLEELYIAHVDRAIRFAYLLTGDRSSAEDLVQDAFVRIFGRFGELRSEAAFSVYLRRTLVNLAHDRHRRGRAEQEQAGRVAGPDAQEMPDVVQREGMKAAITALPTRQRAALVLRFYEDLSEREAADVLGCSLPALKSLVTRGLRTLRAGLEREE
jgi:RNA polymerase sigma-70 factor (sigma-E family)